MTQNSVSEIREKRQEEAAYSFKKQGVIMAAPRFGKIRTSIKIMQREAIKRVLISAPRVDIFTGWDKDFAETGYKPEEVTYTTFNSLHKYNPEDFDMLIVDEIHEASATKLRAIRKFVDTKMFILGLSGTITDKTEKNIYYAADLALCYSYPISLAVEEGILTDYEITIHKVNLHGKPTGKYTNRGKDVSEHEKFQSVYFVMDKLKKQKKNYFHLELQLINMLQNSYSKLMKTKQLINQFADERILVFCGTTEIADSLDIPVYHSKAKEKELFQNFCSGVEGFNHMATIKMAQAGVTVLPIHKGIVNYTSGNPEDAAQKICRFLGLEYNTPSKKADIHLVVAEESFELIRIRTALQFFDKSKIKYA